MKSVIISCLTITLVFIISCNNKNMVHVVTAEKGVYLREQPSANSKAIILMPKGTPVHVLEKTNSASRIDGIEARWWKIRYLNYSGYTFSAFLSETQLEQHDNIVGDYKESISDVIKEGYPSKIHIKGYQTFYMDINLCQGFGRVNGDWKIEFDNISNQLLLRLKITGSDFGIHDHDKIEIHYVINNNELKYLRSIPNHAIGCEFHDGDVFVKK